MPVTNHDIPRARRIGVSVDGIRSLNPTRPPPTVPQASNRIAQIAVGIVVGQCLLNGMELAIAGGVMKYVWWTFGVLAGFGTFRMEKYLGRRRRW